MTRWSLAPTSIPPRVLARPSAGALLLALGLAGCDGDEPKDTSAPVDTGTEDSGDSADTELPPVWDEYGIETSSTLQGVYASGEGVYVVGTGGKAWVGGSGGTWSAMDPEVEENDLTDLWGQGAGGTLNMWATAGSGYVAHHSGGSWSVEDLGTSNHLGIGGDDPASLYTVSWGGIYHFDGATWTFESTPAGERLNEVYGTGAEAIAVGEEGAILRRGGDGTWTAMTSGTTVALNGVAGVSLTDVWAVGGEGTALHYDGTAWTAVDTGVTVTLWAVFAPEASAVYVVGNNGVALRWNGAAFEVLPTGVDNNLYALHGVSGSNVWAVGNRGTAIQFKED